MKGNVQNGRVQRLDDQLLNGRVTDLNGISQLLQTFLSEIPEEGAISACFKTSHCEILPRQKLVELCRWKAEHKQFQEIS